MRFLPLFLLATLLASVPAALATPRLSGAKLRYGTSPRIRYNIWALLECGVINPDKDDQELHLVLTPADQRNMTVYETSLTLKAGKQLTFRTMVTLGTVENYTLTLYAGKHLVQSEPVLTRLVSPVDHLVVVLNDNTNLVMGKFADNEALHGRVFTSFVNAHEAPPHWAGYDQVQAVVVFQPHFAAMTTRQFEALLDYVARGGALYFADPVGLLQADQTPLRDIVPVTPLQVRALEQLSALTAIGGVPMDFPGGVNFLESVPRGTDGLTTITHGDFPLVHLRRFGLGTVAAVAVNPSVHRLQEFAGGRNFAALWNHLLSFGGRAAYVSSSRSGAVTEALDTLTGIEIPRPPVIRVILALYLAVVLLFVVYGFGSKRHLQSWLLLGVVSVVTTGLIFVFARLRSGALHANTAAILDFAVGGTPEATGEQLVSLFAKGERVVQVGGANVDRRVRAFLPVSGKATSNALSRLTEELLKGKPIYKAGQFVDRGKDEVMRDPLRVHQVEGVDRLEDLLLRAFAPRFYAGLYTFNDKPYPSLPQVTWGPTGPELAPWPLPPGLVVSDGVLLGEAGYYPLTLHARTCTLQPGGTTAELQAKSPEVAALRTFLTHANLATPLLALFADLTNDPTGGVPADFQVLGRRVYFVPVRQVLTRPALVLPRERIALAPYVTQARLLRQDDRWVTVSDRSGRSYDFDGVLPPELGRLQVQRLALTFVADNRGRNLNFAAALLARDGDRKVAKTFAPTRRDGDTYLFEDLPFDQIVAPADGSFRFVISVQPIRPISDPIESQRVNAWVVRDLAAVVTGELPPTLSGTY